MCKSMINTVNTNVVAGITTGSKLPLGSVSRKFGCNLGLLGNDIVVNGKGYYEVSALAAVVPSATDVITIQLYQNGVAVEGARGSITIAAGVAAIIPIEKVIRTADVDLDTRLSFVVTPATATTTVTLNNLTVEVLKI